MKRWCLLVSVLGGCDLYFDSPPVIAPPTAISSGAFTTHFPYSTGQQPRAVAIGDLNGDGYADLAVANESGDSVSVLLNRGDGTFELHVNYATGSRPRSLAMADVDGDGHLDVVVPSGNDAAVSILYGNGDGTLKPRSVISTGVVPPQTSSYQDAIAIADVDGDGRLDLVLTRDADKTVAVLRGVAGGFVAAGTYPSNQGYAITTADLDRDGKIDFAVAEPNGTLRVYRNSGDGTFAQAQTFDVGYATSVASADLDGDGWVDLVTASDTPNDVQML